MKTQRTWVFSPLDLITPIGVSLAAVLFCVLSFFRADEAQAKVVVVVTGLVFVGMVPLWYFVRSIKRKFNLQIAGIYVVYGKLNRPSKEQLEEWLDSLVQHWATTTWRSGDQTRSMSPEEVRLAFEGITVFFVDDEKLSVLGRFVRGYSWGRDCVIGFRQQDPVYTKSLFRHEVSHQILGSKEPWDEKKHHAIFQITQLGA